MELQLLKKTYLLLLLLPACRENININTSDAPARLVIYGSITTDTTRHQVRITRSTGYFSDDKPGTVSRADVWITCPDQAITLAESPDDPGLYLTPGDIYGIPGQTYTLHVLTDFSGEEEEYQAQSYLPLPARPDSIAVNPSPLGDDFRQILLWGELPESEGSANYFSLHLYRNNTIVNDSLRGFSVFDDQYVAGKYIKALPIFLLNQTRDRYKLIPGDTLTLRLTSITREYAAFIENAKWENHGSVPLFGGPPANVPTNISCITNPDMQSISGFFTAASIRRTSMIYD